MNSLKQHHGVLILSLLMSACSGLKLGPADSPPATSVVIQTDDTLYVDLGWAQTERQTPTVGQFALDLLAGELVFENKAELSDFNLQGNTLLATNKQGSGFTEILLADTQRPQPKELHRGHGPAPTSLCPIPTRSEFDLIMSWSTQQEVFLCTEKGRRVKELSCPDGWAVPAKVLATESGYWVLDPGAASVQHFDLQGNWLKAFHGRGDTALLAPVDCCPDGNQGIWLLDSWRGGLLHLNAELEVRGNIGWGAEAPGNLFLPISVSRDSRGRLLVLSGPRHSLEIFSPGGALLYRLEESDLLGNAIQVRADSGDRLFIAQRGGGLKVLGFRPLSGTPAWRVQEDLQ